MKACINDDNFMKKYIKSDEIRRLNIMKASHRHDAWVFQATREFATEERIKELKDKKQRKEIFDLNVRDVAKKADLEILYDSAYQLLSDSVHCGPKSTGAYVKADESGKIRSISTIPEGGEIDFVFVTAFQVLVMALDSIFGFFNIDKKKELQSFNSSFQELMKMEKGCPGEFHND